MRYSRCKSTPRTSVTFLWMKKTKRKRRQRKAKSRLRGRHARRRPVRVQLRRSKVTSRKKWATKSLLRMDKTRWTLLGSCWTHHPTRSLLSRSSKKVMRIYWHTSSRFWSSLENRVLARREADSRQQRLWTH